MNATRGWLGVAVILLVVMCAMWMIAWHSVLTARHQVERLAEENTRLMSDKRFSESLEKAIRSIRETADRLVYRLTVEHENLREGDKEYLDGLFHQYKKYAPDKSESKTPSADESK